MQSITIQQFLNYQKLRSNLVTDLRFSFQKSTSFFSEETFIGNYNRFDVGVVVGGGLRYKLGRPVITMDVRYRYNFIPIVANPYANPSDIITFGSDPPDQKILSLPTVNFGVHFPLYNHEKLLK